MILNLFSLVIAIGLFSSGCGVKLTKSKDRKPDSAIPQNTAQLSAIQRLGQKIFEDSNLSVPAGQSCASCHDSSLAFTGSNHSPISAVALGSRPDTFGGRNVPTAMYSGFIPSFSFSEETNPEGVTEYTPVGGLFWDGRASSLVEQAKGPFLNPKEMNNPDAASVVTKVSTSSYAPLFREVFGEDSFDHADEAYDKIAQAIAAFEQTRSFQPFSSKFDDYLRGTAQLTDQETKGFELFKDPEKGNCLACHVGNIKSKASSDWMFTDFTYDNLGVPRNDKIPENQDRNFFDLGLCQRDGMAAKLPNGVELNSLCGVFRVPTLRNIAQTGPYMHNGFFTELRDVVKFYATRDTNPELWYSKSEDDTINQFDDLPPELKGNVNVTEVPYGLHRGDQPRLNDDEIDALVAFLKTLTDR